MSIDKKIKKAIIIMSAVTLLLSVIAAVIPANIKIINMYLEYIQTGGLVLIVGLAIINIYLPVVH